MGCTSAMKCLMMMAKLWIFICCSTYSMAINDQELQELLSVRLPGKPKQIHPDNPRLFNTDLQQTPRSSIKKRDVDYDQDILSVILPGRNIDPRSFNTDLQQTPRSSIKKRDVDYDQDILSVDLPGRNIGSDSIEWSESHTSKSGRTQSEVYGEISYHEKNSDDLSHQPTSKLNQNLHSSDDDDDDDELPRNIKARSNLNTDEIFTRGYRHGGILQEIAESVKTKLIDLGQTAHLPHPRLGLDSSLDPLISSSTLRYVHEGELLQLRLILQNVTLTGLSSLSVQEVDFTLPLRGQTHIERLSHDEWEPEGRGTQRGPERRKGKLHEGLVRVAFTNIEVNAKYQVRGSARGFLTFRESGNLTLTSPTIFLTSRVVFSLTPGSSDAQARSPGQRRRQGGRAKIKVVKVRSDISLSPSSLHLRPTSSPPQFVRQQVQSKMEELTSDLTHGHGAVRLLLRRWGRALKRLVHKAARTTQY